MTRWPSAPVEGFYEVNSLPSAASSLHGSGHMLDAVRHVGEAGPSSRLEEVSEGGDLVLRSDFRTP